MNLPNKLTIARVIMIPLFLICLYLNIGCGKYIAVGIFILASLTDLLDGKIARKYNLVPNGLPTHCLISEKHRLWKNAG